MKRICVYGPHNILKRTNVVVLSKFQVRIFEGRIPSFRHLDLAQFAQNRSHIIDLKKLTSNHTFCPEGRIRADAQRTPWERASHSGSQVESSDRARTITQPARRYGYGNCHSGWLHPRSVPAAGLGFRDPKNMWERHD